ncbi:hypothetical protein SISNIDRAFT_50630 [Sistotremastrum niveocremeum HHB9708]|uniref:Uncharacterized protein n=1 Tax=Sistotremastrum niveocremeum HHB9708 TaxID=1314777 RepID=A0A164VZP0_9AGAM|nr:hypothetical protein SISNIDRAFT_50630 [Sistotremastrum niveocremeum HHB9708]
MATKALDAHADVTTRVQDMMIQDVQDSQNSAAQPKGLKSGVSTMPGTTLPPPQGLGAAISVKSRIQKICDKPVPLGRQNTTPTKSNGPRVPLVKPSYSLPPAPPKGFLRSMKIPKKPATIPPPPLSIPPAEPTESQPSPSVPILTESPKAATAWGSDAQAFGWDLPGSTSQSWDQGPDQPSTTQADQNPPPKSGGKKFNHPKSRFHGPKGKGKGKWNRNAEQTGANTVGLGTSSSKKVWGQGQKTTSTANGKKFLGLIKHLLMRLVHDSQHTLD